MSTEEDVIFKSIGNAGVITLNRPKALNALNVSMVDKIHPKLKEWEGQKHLIIINGTGEKAFCAGGDVRVIVESGFKGGKLGFEFFRKEYSLNGYIGRYKKPYVAIIDGIVMGGGVGLSVHGPYRIATERSVFAMPETAIGLFPDVGGSYFLPRLQGKLGTYLALTGHRLTGSDIYKAGIATHYCESQSIKELEELLVQCSNHDDIKNVLNKFNKNDGKPFSLDSILPKINKCFAAPTVEQIIQELETDGSDWAKGVLNTLAKMSPTSLKVSLKIMQEGAKLPLDRCLEMEYRVAVGCLTNTDFYEGVRALLIDKDQKPKWNPSSVMDVSETIVNSYFNKLSDDQELIHKL
ncbi:hypothetical protein RN001_006310 [Aquatica leii]|uniref:3-hydroxyisobutyryl-CoA hydrolase, mitochondrial n=1 Tax=Aquatica leii TaxID=1421715 RepID=A0AAN7SBC4_9COLE|nr:hypothetical protein RN001_006310 [Aquatica leii]